MTVDGRATRKTDGLADRPAGTISPAHGAVSMLGAKSDASASYGGRANDSPAPFSDLLTAMIQAQALENELIRQHENATVHAAHTAPFAADRMRRVLTQGLNGSIAALIVTAAIGVVIFFLQQSMRQPDVVAAGNDSPKAALPASVRATQEPAPRAEEPGGLEKPVESERATKHGIATGSIVAAQSDDEPAPAPPVNSRPIENLASGTDKLGQAEAPEKQSSGESTHFGAIAPAHAPAAPSEPSPQAAPSQPPSGETESATGPSNDTVATRPARTNNHVNMRAGPSNDQAVVMRIPAGSPVQVVKCRHWCEVIFDGQQGWVYKSFVDTSPMPQRP